MIQNFLIKLNLTFFKTMSTMTSNVFVNTLTTDFFYAYTWSDSIFRNFLIKKNGLQAFLVKTFTVTWNLFLQNLKRQIPVATNDFSLQLTYNQVALTVEKFYLRNLFFGNLFNVTVLNTFFKAIKNNPKINIGFPTEGVNSSNPVLVVASAGLVEPTRINPLFSAKAHWEKDNKNIFANISHPFHLVDPSPWPFCTSMGLWYLTLTTVAFFHKFVASPFYVVAGVVYLALALSFWWRDVIRESTYEHKHTSYVRQGLLTGMMLFIISEVMFFFGFFWAFFHSSLVPSANIGGVWPPAVIDVISPWQLPLVNTLCLLLSGVTLTIAHRQLNGLTYFNQTVSAQLPLIRRLVLWMQVTVFLGVFFLSCQALEYYLSPFTFQDTVFGGTFYILTGLHGLHVVVGTIFLIVCTWRASRLHFTTWKQVGFKSAAWYWHFVDVVWLFLFVVIYFWGGLGA